MEKVLVINLTAMTQHVGVVHKDGAKDHVQIMPKRRVELRDGLSVDPSWLGLNPNVLRVVQPQPVIAKAIDLSEPLVEVPSYNKEGEAQ